MYVVSLTNVHCHGCQGVLTVPSDPVSDPRSWKGDKLVPLLNAPFICDVCRRNPKKLKAARVEMEKFIGPAVKSKGFE